MGQPNTAKYVNKINQVQVTTKRPKFEIIIRKGRNIVFRNKIYAGVVAVLNDELKFNAEEGSIEGDVQTYAFGNPIEEWFSFDQLQKKLHEVFRLGATLAINALKVTREHVQPKPK